jgi:hypothetical protein
MIYKYVAKGLGNDLVRRAYAAYFRAPGKTRLGDSESVRLGDSESVLCESEDGKQYVVIGSGDGVLAVYRVRNDGMLKSLKRWPRQIAEVIPA